ncbi:MAG TPA: hypothetical protein VIW95_15765 [Candidatus Binatus sp.]|uniref:hypothetical protein n=1 Tax=Candidatus Binatus sp. TaxID=2811406 RepID=UPI002F3E8651
MEIDKIVADLKKERDRLVKAIAALVGVGSTTTGKRRGRKPGRKATTTTRKRRGGISKAGRKRLSELMKKRWAERRKKGMTKLGK